MMRQEIQDLIVKAELENHIQIGRMDGEQFIIVDSYDTVEKLQKLIDESSMESDGAEAELGDWGYQDEYMYCSCCYEYVSVSPKYNGMPNDYVVLGLDAIDYYCLKCVKEHPYKQQYIEERINNKDNALERNGIFTDDDLMQYGFQKHDSYSAGWNYGMSDSPENVMNRLSNTYNDVLFVIDDYNPFDTHYSAWVRN